MRYNETHIELTIDSCPISAFKDDYMLYNFNLFCDFKKNNNIKLLICKLLPENFNIHVECCGFKDVHNMY